MPKVVAAKHVYKMAKPLSKGTELEDHVKTRWVISDVIGQGGFGQLYSAYAKDTPGEAKYVIKIEPQENGPLFTEIHFYTRVCKTELLEEFRREHNLSFLGIPRFVAKGLFLFPGEKPCRFLVMDRFDGSLEDSLNRNEFTASNLSRISIQVVDALEYIHKHQYVHADIKAGNLLRSSGNMHFCLADFGLVTHYVLNGKHKEEKPSPKLKDNGTLEFCSRDTHIGLPPSRRGDMEIFAFNIVHWLFRSKPGSPQTSSAGLPWANHISADRQMTPQSRQKVVSAKEDAMRNPKTFANCAGLGKLSSLETFLTHVGALRYTEEPDYTFFRNILGQLVKETAKLSMKSGRGFIDENVTVSHTLAKSSRSKPKLPGRATPTIINADLVTKVSTGAKRGRPVLVENDRTNQQSSKLSLIELATAASARHRNGLLARATPVAGNTDSITKTTSSKGAKRSQPVLAKNDKANQQPYNTSLTELAIAHHKSCRNATNGPSDLKTTPVSPANPRHPKRPMYPKDSNYSSCVSDTGSTPRRNPPRQARRVVNILPFDRSFDDDMSQASS